MSVTSGYKKNAIQVKFLVSIGIFKSDISIYQEYSSCIMVFFKILFKL